MSFFRLMIVIALCSCLPVAASGKRLASMISKYVIAPATIWAAGYLEQNVKCVENRTLAARYAEHANQIRKMIVIKPACPAIIVKPVSSGPAFALSEDAIKQTFSEDFLSKTSFIALITSKQSCNQELTPLTLMHYLDICLDTYCSIYNSEWRHGREPNENGQYLPRFSLDEKLAFLKQLLHEHPAAYAEAEGGWLVVFDTEKWRKRYGHQEEG